MSASSKRLGRLLALCLLVLPAAGQADDSVALYESVADTTIGPVFLTQAQREWLDRRRHLPPEPAVAVNTGEPSGNKPVAVKKPAGYIVSSRGRRSDWSDGDFVATDDASAATKVFPGDVELLRHDQNSADVQRGDDSNENDE